MKPAAVAPPLLTSLTSLPSAPFGTLQRKCACGGSAGAGGGCDDCTKKEMSLQRYSRGVGGPGVAPPIVHEALRSPGSPLDAATRAFFEPRFGHDFSKVRVYTGTEAAEAARTVNALAYTAGAQIVFGAGQYQPNAAGGRRLLAHELTHVVQQHGQVPVMQQLRIGPSDDAYEREANQNSRNLTAGNASAPSRERRAAPVSVQRSCRPAEIGHPSGCTSLEGDVQGEHYLFDVNCDTFKPGFEDKLKLFAETLTSGGSIKIHGFASEEGDPSFNENLSCARAIKGQEVINRILVPKGVSVGFSLFLHGATAGNRDDRRSITIDWLPAGPEPSPTPGPTPEPGPGPTVGPGPVPSQVECSLKHIEDECNGATAQCATVATECSSDYPTPKDIDDKAKDTRATAVKWASSYPNASTNLSHFLDATGTELTMPVSVFETHAETKKKLLNEHRVKFLEGAKRRLDAGTLTSGSTSEQMVWTGTANAFTLPPDDLGLAVGGYTLCSRARVRADPVGGRKFKITFVEWTVQAFDCYNWDPGKGIGLPGLSDKNMCCLENAGKGKHYRIRTEQWSNKDPDSTRDGEV